MRTSPEILRRSLSLAVEALKEYKHDRRHWKYHFKANPTLNEPYHWLKLGWEANDFDGFFYDLPNALRPFVPGGDLTLWWQTGRTKQDTIRLFMEGIRSLPADLEAA